MTITAAAVNQEQLDALCAWLCSGKSVRKYLEENDAGFSRGTFYDWLETYADQAQKDQYARALAASAESDFDDVRYIADTEKDPAMMRSKVDAVKWLAGQKKPKKYGPKSTAELVGKDGAPAIFTLNLGTPNPLDDND